METEWTVENANSNRIGGGGAVFKLYRPCVQR